MKFSRMMKTVNSLIKKGIVDLNKCDVESIFGSTSEQMVEALRYLGCDVTRCADLFNVKLPEKFTKEEIDRQVRIEKLENLFQN